MQDPNAYEFFCTSILSHPADAGGRRVRSEERAV